MLCGVLDWVVVLVVCGEVMICLYEVGEIDVLLFDGIVIGFS